MTKRLISARLIAIGALMASACSEEVVSAPPSTTVQALGISEEEVERIEAYLADRTPADAIVSSTTLYGEDVDCIDMHEQPSVRALRAAGVDIGVLPTAPQQLPQERDIGPAEGEEEAEQVLDQACPDGTIPIRRLSVEEIAEFGGLDAYLEKEPPAIDTHEYATVGRDDLETWGAESRVNTWSPAGGASGDFTISQIWVSGGSGDDLETVEAGWIKRQSQSSSRLFIFFTPDAYGSGSCWNTDCGFVQTNSNIVLDGTFNSYSSSGGSQYSNHYHLYKDSDAGHWWFGHRGEWVGYWPRTLFNSSGIRNHGDAMVWGGEVYDLAGASHTSIDMGGDGSFADGSGDFGHAAYQNKIRYNSNNEGQWSEVEPDPWNITDADCYDLIQDYDSISWKNYIYFGGPGYNATNCPL